MTDQMIMDTFKLYAELNAHGKILKENAKLFQTNDEVRGMLMAFAGEVDCTIIAAGNYLYLTPLTKNSIYHVSNEEIKNKYFPSRALNMDIYLMYVSILIFVGEFYDSYQSTKPTRAFLSVVDWLTSLNERLLVLREYEEDYLKKMEVEYEVNWLDILKNWEAMDNVKEGIRRRTARTVSRMSFMMIVKQFMLGEGIVKEVGPDELVLTEKANAIVSKYFMEYEYNRGIIEFIYQLGEEA